MSTALEIVGTFDVSDIVDGFDDVGAAAKDMDNDVASAASSADSSMSGLADSADNLGSSSSQAAGGLGDLGGALSLMPGPLGAVGGGMESLAPAIMGVTGASDLLKLATESQIVTSAKAKASAVAHTAATVAQNAATKAAAVGQWALNAAMTANPIGLAIAAAAALIGLFVLLYRRSETFRSAVDEAGEIAGAALGWISEQAQMLGGKVEDLLEPVGGVSGAVEALGTVGETAFNLWLTPIRTVIGLVEDLINFIDDIDFPDLPDIPGLRVGSSTTASGTSSSTTVYNVSGLLDQRLTEQLLLRQNLQMGYPVP